MAPTLEPIAARAGKIRKDLITEGFSEQEAFQIVVDLIRRGDSPSALIED